MNIDKLKEKAVKASVKASAKFKGREIHAGDVNKAWEKFLKKIDENSLTYFEKSELHKAFFDAFGE